MARAKAQKYVCARNKKTCLAKAQKTRESSSWTGRETGSKLGQLNKNTDDPNLAHISYNLEQHFPYALREI
jgi:hypothetical protein